MPLAPPFMAALMARRMARRNETLLAGHLVEVGPDAVGLGAAAADDHARPGGVDVDPHPVAGALDLHPGDAGVAQVPLQVAADLDVPVQVLLVVLLAEPARLPVGGDTRRKPYGLIFCPITTPPWSRR